MKNYVLILCLGVWLGSCDSEEATPTYLIIDEVSLLTSTGQGANTQLISDLWVNQDGQDIGVYPLPATIPIYGDGVSNFLFRPGVRVNGIAAFAEPYTYYAPIDRDVDLSQASSIDIDLITTYRDDIDFVFIDDFESIFRAFARDQSSNGSPPLMTTNQDVRSGNLSGLVTLTEDQNELFLTTDDFDGDVVNSPRPLFLEMDYKADISFGIWALVEDGLGSIQQIEIVSLRPRDTYTKLYLDVSEIKFVQGGAQSFRLAIIAFYNPNQDDQSIYLDNLKLNYQP